MKKILFFGLLLLTGFAFSQNSNDIPRCGSVNYINYMEGLHPGYKNYVEQQFQIAKNNHLKSNDTYVIPVVVHIVYNPNNPAENIPDSVVHKQIAVLNRCYQRLNPDTANLRDSFNFIAGNPNIQFKLATIDPNGDPTTGITRTETNVETFMDAMGFISGDMSSVERVKSDSVGIAPWDQDHYLNIWVCDMSMSFGGQSVPALLGYATPPGGLPNWPAGSTNGMKDGVVIQYQAFGGPDLAPISVNGQTIPVKGRTTVHETGHYLGLRHIWGDGDCTKDDGIIDTPNADSKSEGCPVRNTCMDSIGPNKYNLPDMFENYMDYSDEPCQNTFTKGQVSLMRGVLENQRYDLVHGNPASIAVQKFTASVYPVPSSDKVNVSIDNGKITSVKVVGMSGRLIKTLNSYQSVLQIDISNLEKGIYFLKIKNNYGAVNVERIVKN